jgi:hypothetical protein
MGVSSIFYEFVIIQRLRLRKQTTIHSCIGACRSGGFVNAASISAGTCIKQSSVLFANRKPQLHELLPSRLTNSTNILRIDKYAVTQVFQPYANWYSIDIPDMN